MTVLAATSVGKSYWHRGRRHPVLAGVSLAAAPGSVVAVLGPSGVGKSTLLRILAGLEAPDAGQVLLDGQPVKAGHPELAVMFQDPCLLPWLTVWENVLFGVRFDRRPWDERRRAAREALERVGLAAFADWYPAQLSGGMSQRVALARALARRPRVLLLDEPFSKLDASTRAQLQDDLRRIATATGLAVVLVTHDVDEALGMADQLVVLNHRPAQVVLSRRVEHPFPRDVRSPGLESWRRELLAALSHPLVPAGRRAV